LLGAQVGAVTDRRSARQGDRFSAPAADDRRGDRRDAGDAYLDGVGDLTRIGLGKLWRLEPLEPANRYEKRRPGELIHVDVKKLGRISGGAGHRITGNRRKQGSSDHSARSVGWEYVHVAIDDATRLVYAEVLADEKALTAIGFLRRAVAHFAAFGIRVERLMTDG
jgi:hypothetical protein